MRRTKEEYFEKIKEIINSRSGILLSNNYVNCTTNIRVKCDEGHIWDVPPERIMRNSWCRLCARKKINESRKITFEDIREIARSRGWECLSDKYINYNTKLIWKCNKEHIFRRTPRDIQRMRGCSVCKKKMRTTFEYIKNIATIHGGECLSEKYINASKKLSLKCKNSHTWKATGNSVLNGTWCPSCSNRKIYTTMDMHQLAKLNNGKLLSEKFIRLDFPLKWQCENGHIFDSMPGRIIAGYWCQRCAKDKLGRNIGSMCVMAASFNGKCLSKEYVNANTPLLWECSEGHKWKARPGDVKHKRSWCKICRINEIRKRSKYSIVDFRNIASKKEGKVISKKYNWHIKLVFQCKYSHRWRILPKYAIKGFWCPACKEEKRLKKRIEDMRMLAKNKGGQCLSEKYIYCERKLLWKCKEGHIWEDTPSKINSGRWCTACKVEERHKNKLEIMKS